LMSVVVVRAGPARGGAIVAALVGALARLIAVALAAAVCCVRDYEFA